MIIIATVAVSTGNIGKLVYAQQYDGKVGSVSLFALSK